MFVKCGNRYINLDNVAHVLEGTNGMISVVTSDRGQFFIDDPAHAAPLLEALNAELQYTQEFIAGLSRPPFDHQLRPMPLDVLLVDPLHAYPEQRDAAA